MQIKILFYINAHSQLILNFLNFVVVIFKESECHRAAGHDFQTLLTEFSVNLLYSTEDSYAGRFSGRYYSIALAIWTWLAVHITDAWLSTLTRHLYQSQIRDLENIGSVLDAAVQAGANNIFGIQFDVEDREAAQQQAMTAAMANAQARAEVLAEAAGVEIGDILSLQTYLGSSSPIPYGGAYDMMAEQAAMAVPVSPGQMQIMVDVSVVYEIR